MEKGKEENVEPAVWEGVGLGFYTRNINSDNKEHKKNGDIKVDSYQHGKGKKRDEEKSEIR